MLNSINLRHSNWTLFEHSPRTTASVDYKRATNFQLGSSVRFRWTITKKKLKNSKALSIQTQHSKCVAVKNGPVLRTTEINAIVVKLYKYFTKFLIFGTEDRCYSKWSPHHFTMLLIKLVFSIFASLITAEKAIIQEATIIIFSINCNEISSHFIRFQANFECKLFTFL